MAKKYEIMTISNISLGEAGAKELLVSVQEQVKDLGGKVSDHKPWGKRSFSYPINHDTEGYYDVFNFEMDKKDLDQLKSKLNLLDGLVRYLISALD